MTPRSAGAIGLFAVLGVFSIVWIVSVRRRDASIIDIWWGPGCALLSWLYCILLGPHTPRALLLAALITAWGARLAWHLATRQNAAGEDPRYTEIRTRHGRAFWWRSLFLIFWLQAALVWAIVLPVLCAASDAAHVPLGPIDAVGLLVFATGLAFEAIADQQLRRFRANVANRGRVLDAGLWRYTRHPNYFGDAVLWWGVYVLAVSTPLGRWTIFSPALMTFLLLRVSGVTLLERNLQTSKPDYAAYVARTSAFVPWFPRSEA